MQAIFVECVLGGVQEERVRKMAKQSHRNPVTYEPDSFRDQYRRGGIKYLALIGRSRRIVADHWQSRFCFGQLSGKNRVWRYRAVARRNPPVSVVSHWTLIFARVDDQ